ncbi:hypothetical protein [Nocardioides sp.]|uniref:hypothetical protein n=1 Tax=Nocardioides sp. TaxID=35761 RepID=UPI002C881FEC|nr:hypothetical protein [Nocardioides sp.]HSX67594.1 hypothetical protein [Nocardioides sp.]
MSKKYDGIARISVAGGIAAVGLTLGGVAMANAADDTSSAGTTTSSAAREGFGHRGGPGGGDLAADLAEELGVSESKVSDALDAVREDLPAPERPAAGERPTPPTAAERAAHETALAEALAGELDLTTAKVSDALAAMHAEHEAAHRSALSSRLDDAVEAGDLTAADKASVLKAFDAGVLGGPRG